MNDKGHYHSYKMGAVPPEDLPVEAVVPELSWLTICWATGSGASNAGIRDGHCHPRCPAEGCFRPSPRILDSA